MLKREVERIPHQHTHTHTHTHTHAHSHTHTHTHTHTWCHIEGKQYEKGNRSQPLPLQFFLDTNPGLTIVSLE